MNRLCSIQPWMSHSLFIPCILPSSFCFISSGDVCFSLAYFVFWWRMLFLMSNLLSYLFIWAVFFSGNMEGCVSAHTAEMVTLPTSQLTFEAIAGFLLVHHCLFWKLAPIVEGWCRLTSDCTTLVKVYEIFSNLSCAINTLWWLRNIFWGFSCIERGMEGFLKVCESWPLTNMVGPPIPIHQQIF